MRRHLALIGAVAAALWTPSVSAAGPAASAGFLVVGGPARATNFSSAAYPLAVSGLLTVTFHSDPASGCARLSACGYQGTYTMKPASGQLLIAQYTLKGRRHAIVGLMLGNTDQSLDGPTVVARVVRAGGGVCSDLSNGSSGSATDTSVGGRLDVPLANAMAPTRCAGPLAADLTNALPILHLAARPAGGTRIDTAGVRRFASRGFAGTVTSTLVFTVGRAISNSAGSSGAPPGVRTQRDRIVNEDLGVVATTGSIVADVRGTQSGDVCILLDSCGLTGTLTLTPKPTASQGGISVAGPAKLPYSDFLVALGRRSGSVSERLHLLGEVYWSDRGTITANLNQGGACHDVARIGSGYVTIAVTRRRVVTTLNDQGAFGTARTRCPGPEFSSLATIASGSAPRSVLRQRTFSLTLTGGPSFTDDGYSVALHGSVTLTFRAGKIASQVQEIPTG